MFRKTFMFTNMMRCTLRVNTNDSYVLNVLLNTVIVLRYLNIY
jgi:hypothetical protein